jgi:hypothetical protein
MKRQFLLMVLGASLLAWPAQAHHSFNAEYDMERPARLRGRIVRLDWVNPHASIVLAVSDGQNGTIEWRAELGPPSALSRTGLTKSEIRPGMDIVVDGFLARNGTPKLGGTSITIQPTGRVFTVPTSNFAGAPQ